MRKLIILFTLLIFFGCSSDDTNSDENNNNQINPEVAENVVIVLDENSDVTSSETNLNNGLYNIEFSNDVPEIRVNDIIVGDEGEGFLRKVVSVSANGNTLSIQTSQATIDDVFNNVSIQFNTDISENSRLAYPIKQKTQVNYLREGVSINEDGLTYDFSNTVLFQDAVGTFKITNGNASFNPNFSFNADYSLLGGLDFLEFKTNNADLIINCDFDVTVNGALNLTEFSETLVDYDRYLTFLVAGVPVVVVVNTQLVAELSADVETSATWLSSWTNTFGVTTGVKYENSNWTGNFDLGSNLVINSMDFGGQVNIAQNLTITPRASLKFYGVIGPYCQPEMTEDFTFNVASPSLDWDADLKAGLDLTTGVDITIFGNTLEDFNTTNSYEESIWNAPTNLTIESGNNQTGNQGQLLDEALVVKVTDVLDNPMPFVPVHFTVTQGGGNLDEQTVMTDDNGFAQVFWTLGDNTDPQTVEAIVKKADGTNIEGTPISFNANSEENPVDLSGTWTLNVFHNGGSCTNDVSPLSVDISFEYNVTENSVTWINPGWPWEQSSGILSYDESTNEITFTAVLLYPINSTIGCSSGGTYDPIGSTDTYTFTGQLTSENNFSGTLIQSYIASGCSADNFQCMYSSTFNKN